MRKPFSSNSIYFIERRSFTENHKFSNKNNHLPAWRKIEIFFFAIFTRPNLPVRVFFLSRFQFEGQIYVWIIQVRRVNWFTTGVIASWWSPLLFSWAISCFVTKVETSGIWVVLEFGELLCPFLGDTILVTILVDLLIFVVDWESTWRFEVWARRFLSLPWVFCGGKKINCHSTL